MLDREILRELSKKYAQIASLSIQERNINNWKALNSLKSVKPMVVIDQIPWHQMHIGDELILKCTDPFYRGLEWQMREEIYKWTHFPCDMVVRNYIRVNKVVKNSGIGIDNLLFENEGGLQGAQTHLYVDQIKDEEAVENLKLPILEYDEQETKRHVGIANDLIGDILPIYASGDILWEAVWDRIVFWRGATTVLYDLADRPEYLHKLMKKMAEIEMSTIDQMEQQNLFEIDPKSCHCAYTFTDELPKPGFKPNHVRAKDCWVSGAAQIFSEVSPSMHDEFEIEYLKPVYERFGLVNYGCCEPLHNKINIIKKINNVRLISMSPWANIDIASEVMGNQYVMARKPNPSFLASGNVDEASIRKEIQHTLATCAKNSTPFAYILKDITTLNNNPKALTDWYNIVKSEIDNF